MVRFLLTYSFLVKYIVADGGAVSLKNQSVTLSAIDILENNQKKGIIMNYQEFCQEFKQGVLRNKEWNIKEENYKFYPDGFTADGDKRKLEFIRNTNIKYHSMQSDVLKGDFAVLTIAMGELVVDCRFSMEYLFGEFMEGSWDDVWQIVDDNIKTLRKFEGEDFSRLTGTYEEVKQQLIIRLINYTDNKYELKECLYKICGDVALVLYVVMYDDERGFGSAKVHKKQFAEWNQDWDEVFAEALANTNVRALPRMYMNPEETRKPPYERGAFMSSNSNITEIKSSQVPILTTTKKINGAIVMFYPGVREKIAELIGGSYYVVFTSIHEARVHRVGSVSTRWILNSLKNVNKSFLRNEVLSRKIFLYDAEKNVFEPLEL